MVDIKKFKHENRDFCNKFNKMLDLYYRGISYLESKTINETDINKYIPVVVNYTRELSAYMQKFKEITGEDMPNRIIYGGFIIYDDMDY
ncbi:hypothetical protein FDF74_11625 [Clostridium niameyense]|uniref:Uncharacterized protein n=1 Tax=Clostridium niameyense TaxID=1622073 RepID=A0A6M0RC03_9CLOT|nr:hypothetical protein [Clostridium niameyense]NEZ47831.1 hypothetical protein [Clostridium niameyense]